MCYCCVQEDLQREVIKLMHLHHILSNLVKVGAQSLRKDPDCLVPRGTTDLDNPCNLHCGLDSDRQIDFEYFCSLKANIINRVHNLLTQLRIHVSRNYVFLLCR